MAIIMALSLALPAWAEDPDLALQAERGVVILPGENAVPVGKGCWLPEKKCIETAKRIEAAEQSNFAIVVVVAVVAAAAGFGAARLVK